MLFAPTSRPSAHLQSQNLQTKKGRQNFAASFWSAAREGGPQLLLLAIGRPRQYIEYILY